jgi:hypothetical protein
MWLELANQTQQHPYSHSLHLGTDWPQSHSSESWPSLGCRFRYGFKKCTIAYGMSSTWLDCNSRTTRELHSRQRTSPPHQRQSAQPHPLLQQLRLRHPLPGLGFKTLRSKREKVRVRVAMCVALEQGCMYIYFHVLTARVRQLKSDLFFSCCLIFQFSSSVISLCQLLPILYDYMTNITLHNITNKRHNE